MDRPQPEKRKKLHKFEFINSINGTSQRIELGFLKLIPNNLGVASGLHIGATESLLFKLI